MEFFFDILKAIALGIVQGLTEFLPVSSTGHLIIVERFMRLSENATFVASFQIIIQLGSILAVLFIFWKRLFPFGQGEEHCKRTMNLWLLVIIGVLPAVVLGFLFDDFIEERLFNPIVVAAALIFYGIILIFIEKFKNTQNPKITDANTIPVKIALAIGFFQCLAMVPGTSRSGATIIGALILGLSRKAAVEYSFFLAIPTIFGASFLRIIKTSMNFSAFEIILIAVGFVVSFAVAWAVIKVFMDYISKKSFAVFGYYRVVLGIAVGILFGLGFFS